MKIKKKNKRVVIEKSRFKLPKIDFKLLFICLFIVYFVSYIGSQFVVIDSWYYSVRPSITPPSFVFSVVWTILFFLIGLALYFSLKEDKIFQKNATILYSINLILNILWSFFYFTMHDVVTAFIILILLLASIVVLIYYHWRRKRIVSYLLMPYLIWICFAGVLNLLTIIGINFSLIRILF